MTLQDTLTEMLPHGYTADSREVIARHMLATPEGKALAALVEAAVAWDHEDGDTFFNLVEALDAYRKATE